jgi:hypothetical protein
MVKVLTLIGIIFFTNIFAAAGLQNDDPNEPPTHTAIAKDSNALRSTPATIIEDLNAQLRQMEGYALNATIFTNVASYRRSSEETIDWNDILLEAFAGMIDTLGESPFITFLKVTTIENAEIARDYYLSVSINLSAIATVLGFEILAFHASLDTIDDEKRNSFSDSLRKANEEAEKVRRTLSREINIETRSLVTREEAVAAREYYLGFRESLIEETMKMTEDAKKARDEHL